MIASADALNCHECLRLKEKAGTKPQCWKMPCRNSDAGFWIVDLYIEFWQRRRNQGDYTQWKLLEITGLDTEFGVELMTWMDSKFESYLAEERQKSAN